ncbi:MAG: YraN family protein [Phycisphaerales bacterium]|nr:YraN family protein [Phycisphaerales bacterium]
MNPWRRLQFFLALAAPDTAFVGRRGEDAAARYLRRRGYRVLDRNVVLPSGELDLVCETDDERQLILVEVKSRSADAAHPNAPPPEAAVDEDKKDKLTTLALELLRKHPHLRHPPRPTRIDVIGVDVFHPGAWRERTRLRHYESAVQL